VIIRSINLQKDLPLSARFVRLVVRLVLKQEDRSCSEINIYLVTKRRICDLHRKFFADPSPTDCISFPMDRDFLGEVFVCPRIALQYVENHGGDPYREVALYIIHGVLHLLNYDDRTPTQRRVMRKKEKRCIAYLDELRFFS
jgi:probable rRNA maturation factor